MFIAPFKVLQIGWLRPSAQNTAPRFTTNKKCIFGWIFRILTAIISASTGRIWTKLTFLESGQFGAQKLTKIVFLVLVEVPENVPIGPVHRIQ